MYVENTSTPSVNTGSIPVAVSCASSGASLPQLELCENLYIRTLCTCLSYSLMYSEFKLLAEWLIPEPFSVSEFPDQGAVYTKLALEIFSCQPQISISTNFYQIQSLLSLTLTGIPIASQRRMWELLISSPDMREQLTLAFDSLATAHFSRCTRARENFSSPDYEQPIEQKSRLNPQLLSRMATLLGKASS